MNNPFTPPLRDAQRKSPVERQRVGTTRTDLSGRLAKIGCLGGAVTGTVGFLALIAAVELLLTPPFKSPPNYGQFGIVVFGMGLYSGVFGLCRGLVPYVSWLGYIPFHLLGLWLIWSMDKQFFSSVDWTEAPIVVMFVVLCLPTPIAILADWWVRGNLHAPKSG